MPLLAGDIGARGLPWRCFAGRDAGRTLSAQVYPSSCDAACAPGDFYWGKWIASQLEEKAMAEDSATQGTYDGSRDGIVSELGCYLHVRPGHAEDLRNAVREFATSAGRRGMVGAAEKIGVRTLRGTLFDNDTRFLFATTFDTDWDTYVDDAVEMMGGIAPWGKFLQYCEEVPPDAGTPGAVGNADAKELLDNPDAAEALKHPALKPLLDQAAE